MVESLAPEQLVHHFDVGDGSGGGGVAKIVRTWKTPTVATLEGIQLRGGTNAVLWRGRYIAVGHYRDKNNWNTMAAYTFQNKPPFSQVGCPTCSDDQMTIDLRVN